MFGCVCALALILGENIYFYLPPFIFLALDYFWIYDLFWITFIATAISAPTTAVPMPTTFLLLCLLLLPLLCLLLLVLLPLLLLLPLLRCLLLLLLPLWGSYGAISMREGWVPYVCFTVLFVWVVLTAFGERICFDFGCAISWVFEHRNLHMN